MKEKILALLLAKFAGVRKDGLAQLATAMSIQAADDAEATALVEKITQEKVDGFVKDWRKDVDKELSDSNKTLEGNLKKKYDFVEKKEPDPGKDPKPVDPKDDTPAWAKALIDQNKTLADKIAAFEGSKTAETRLQQIEAKFKDVPDTYKSQRLADAKLLVTSMDETAFAEYSTRLDADVAGFKQELADKGLSGQTRPMMGGQNKDGVSHGVASFIASKAEEGKALTGKEI